MQLESFGERRPAQLSGGQRQRIALARALINQPQVLLLDEPLGALDLKLREDMQTELKSLQQRLGITFVFVTHDQGEALSMADRVAVFNQGRIEQLDAPRDLYARPRTAFVADFVGSANVVPAQPRRAADESRAGICDPARADRRSCRSMRRCRPVRSSARVCSWTCCTTARAAAGTCARRLDDDRRVAGGDCIGAAALPAPGSRVRLAWSAASIVPLKE